MKRIVLTAAILVAWCLPTPAQEHVECNVSASIVSQYLWRGSEKGGPTVSPVARVSWKGLSLEMRGVTGLRSSDAREVHLSLGYRLDFLSLELTDYWATGREYSGRDLYFDFNPRTGGHQTEATVGIDLGFCRLDAYTMIWGNDYKYDTEADTDKRTNGRRAFSTYIELGVPFRLGGLKWCASAGFTPFQGAYATTLLDNYHGLRLYKHDNLYSDRAALIMASLRATKDLQLGGVGLKLFAEWHSNPYLQKNHVVLGMCIHH